MCSRVAKLMLAAAVTVVVCAAVVYVTEPHLPYWVYRCLEGADSKIACLRGQPTTFRTTTLGITYDGTTEDWIDKRVLIFGAFERSEMFFLRDVSSGGIFVDVGAHKGLYSAFMSKYQKEVRAFEPYEPVLKNFRALVARNGLRNIVIHPVGLGDKRARVTFEKPRTHNLGLGSFTFVSKQGAHEELEIVTGDEALREAGVTQVDLIKMDIEGFELPALRGLAETLAPSRPIVLFEMTLAEANRHMLFQSMDQVSKTFPPGYKFLVFKDRDPYTGAYELVPLAGSANFGSRFEQHNVVAFPAEKENRIPLKGPVRTD
jgi:FkbM family methyltransferase